MKNLLLALTCAVLLSTSTGCCLIDRLFGHGDCGTCCSRVGAYPGCGVGGCTSGCKDCQAGPGPGQGPTDYPGADYAGPPTGAVTYPYYTNRGPRDFLASDPRGIGP